MVVKLNRYKFGTPGIQFRVYKEGDGLASSVKGPLVNLLFTESEARQLIADMASVLKKDVSYVDREGIRNTTGGK